MKMMTFVAFIYDKGIFYLRRYDERSKDRYVFALVLLTISFLEDYQIKYIGQYSVLKLPNVSILASFF